MADLEILVDWEPGKSVEELAHEYVQIKLIQAIQVGEEYLQGEPQCKTIIRPT